MVADRLIIWFRQDLRIHDNEALTDAISKGKEIIPVYVFDERQMLGKTSFGFPKTGKYRAQFLVEGVQDLRDRLKAVGVDLIVRIGKPEDVLCQIAVETHSDAIYCNIERTDEEIKVQDALEQNLWKVGKEICYSRGKMLYYTQDLPFPVSHTPDVFTTFRKEVEKFVSIRKPLPAPSEINGISEDLRLGNIPSIEDFGHSAFDTDKRSAIQFKGGETEGLKRLQYYLWDKQLINTYKKTRNGLIGTDYSSKFSPYLANGFVSPKQIYWEIKKYEKQIKKNDSTYWLFFELLWRDFFRLMGKKHGNQIFLKGGLKNQAQQNCCEDKELFQMWADGKTGVPFVDANMLELKETGFMSNRGRQNVASFLIHDLNINWQMGAEYFESLLVDYDPCSNYGNWNYLAGIGNDPREDRKFNVVLQGKRYDPTGEYVKLWVPSLKGKSAAEIHEPDDSLFHHNQ